MRTTFCDREMISEATARNWEKLNTCSSERLITRANKRRSQKRVLPLEYFSNKDNIKFVLDILDYADENCLDITSVILSLGINLLKKMRIYTKPHVETSLKEYVDIEVIEHLASADLPNDEFDILGLIYQSYMHEGKKNIAGSYYTPLKIACNMIKNYDFSANQTFLDPCCGSGAFLLALSSKKPENIFGIDNDRTAVLISTVNLLLKYSNYEFTPQIYCLDYLMGNSIIQQHPVFEQKFDYIVTNPPWGAMINNCGELYGITSDETFSHFFVKAYRQLKERGRIRFLFPESILNVKAHKDIRKFMAERAGLIGITAYSGSFSGVATKYVDIECGRSANREYFSVNDSGKKRIVQIQSVYETDNMVFNLLSEEDSDIVKIAKNRGKYTLKNSTWALGIVTGDNKAKLFSDRFEGAEKIYTGKEITRYVLKPAKNFIVYNRKNLQQTAKDEIYRAPEKLVYKFISDKLVFAYDNSGSLFLNSANILIPNVPGMNARSVMAFLNSDLFQFLYMKLFGEIKILKGNLAELPFPEISEAENEELTFIVDGILEGDSSKKDAANDFIFNCYDLTEEQRSHVRRAVNGRTDERIKK